MKLIGIGGYARCGKDTFVSIAKDVLTINGYIPLRVAFADQLKLEVKEMLQKNNFDLDIYTTDLIPKTKLRPLLVWWGCTRRDLSPDGKYWVDMVDAHLRDLKKQHDSSGDNTDNVVVLVSDVRFVNEVKWVQETWGGEFIHLRRYKSDIVFDKKFILKKYDDAPNEEEGKNDPLIQKLANQHIEWESLPDLTTFDPLRQIVVDTLNKTKFFNGKLLP